MTRSPLATWFLFGVLALGYAVVHVTIALWGALLLSPLLESQHSSEAIEITTDGDMMVRRYVFGGDQQEIASPYYGLDGKLIPLAEARARKTVSQEGITPQPGKQFQPRSWNFRLAELNDHGTPPTFWYLVAPPDSPGRIFLEGYDSRSRRLIGYIGQAGFSPVRPAIADRFPIASRSYDVWRGAVVSNTAPSGFSYYERYEPSSTWEATHYANIDSSLVWILSQGTILEIDLLQRSIRPLMEIKNAIFLRSWVSVRENRSYWQLLVRTPDQLRIINPSTLAETTLPLAPPQPFHSDSYAETSNGEHIVLTQFDPFYDLAQPSSCEIQWFHPDGTPKKKVSQKLARSGYETPMSGWTTAFFPTLTVPAVMLAVGPSAMAWDGDPRDYATRFRRMFDLTGTWLFVALAIGLACGYACRRREVQIYGNRSWLWPIVVGLCGWFGWIGYICVRPLPARLPDGTYLRRIPEPALATGYEILA